MCRRVANNIFLYRRNELKFLDIAGINWSNQHSVTASSDNRLQSVKAGFRSLADIFSWSDVAQFTRFIRHYKKNNLISFYVTFAFLVIIAILSATFLKQKIACKELQIIAENEKKKNADSNRNQKLNLRISTSLRQVLPHYPVGF